MGLLQSPDPAIKLARQYGIRGIFTPEIVPSLQPVVMVDDLSGTQINNTPQRIATALGSVTGVAAESSVFRFEVPPNVIAQVTHFGVKNQANSFLQVNFGSFYTAPATIFTSVYTDGRLRGDGQVPAGILSADTFAVAATTNTLRFGATGSNQTSNWRDVNWIIGRTDGFFDFIEFTIDALDSDATFWLQWNEFDAVAVK